MIKGTLKEKALLLREQKAAILEISKRSSEGEGNEVVHSLK